MSAPLRASDVVVGLIAENTPRLLVQSLRLVRSIRWFGGELSSSRVVVCCVGPMEPESREQLVALGAEIRIVTRFHPASPTGNRQQLLSELLDAPERLMLLLDCDTLVVRDPLPWLDGHVFQAKIAPTPTVSDEVFERLFAHFGLQKPQRLHVARWSGAPTIAYFNAGVLAIPIASARTLAPVWRHYNSVLADHPQLVAPCQRYLHQASLSLALAHTGVPYEELPEDLNLQLNAQHVAAPPGTDELDPVIIHYHQLATDDGFLSPCRYRGAQSRIDLFHARMLKEGFRKSVHAPRTESSRPVVVLGMHRSGTSLVTEVLSAIGLYPGEPDALVPPDIFNPTGYWEHRGVVGLDDDILGSLSANWSDAIANADVDRLPADAREQYVARARAIARSLQGRGGFVIKDPRMSLLFPLWREALGTPICVMAWRHPMAVARSLRTRDGQPFLVSLAAWEHHYRTILRDTVGVPRLLVCYEQLVAEPVDTARALYASLIELGVPGLRMPEERGLRQIVNSDFDRSGNGASEEALLDEGQRDLLASLRSGEVLQAPVAPTSERTFALLEQFGASVRREEKLQADVTELDALLSAMFESRSWRIGRSITKWMGLLQRSSPATVAGRWSENRRRRLSSR